MNEISKIKLNGQLYNIIQEGGASIEDIKKATLKPGTGLEVTDQVINHKNKVTAKTTTSGATKTLNYGDTFTTNEVLYDTEGHVTQNLQFVYTMPGAPANYVLPNASRDVLGGIKVGDNLSINSSGVLSATDTKYTLPIASVQALGGIKVGRLLKIDTEGTLSVDTYSRDEIDAKILGVEPGEFTIPMASSTVLGGIKVGANLSIDTEGRLSATDMRYTLPKASSASLGGIRVGSLLRIDDQGILSVDTYSRAEIEALIPKQGNNGEYVLPIASDVVLGGIKVGDNLEIDAQGKLSADTYSKEQIDLKIKNISVNVDIPVATSDVLGGIRLGDGLRGGYQSGLFEGLVSVAGQLELVDGLGNYGPQTVIKDGIIPYTVNAGYSSSYEISEGEDAYIGILSVIFYRHDYDDRYGPGWFICDLNILVDGSDNEDNSENMINQFGSICIKLFVCIDRNNKISFKHIETNNLPKNIKFTLIQSDYDHYLQLLMHGPVNTRFYYNLNTVDKSDYCGYNMSPDVCNKSMHKEVSDEKFDEYLSESGYTKVGEIKND